MVPCSFCRSQRVASSNGVFACYKMNAHHREVELVDAEGARDGVGILSARSELQKNHVLPKQTERLGTFGDLDPDSTLNSGDGVTFIVSCDECAGFSLGLCIDKGHCQQERYANSLPERSARRVRQRPPPAHSKKTTKTSKASPSTKKPTAGGGGGGGGKGGVHETGKAGGVGEARGDKGGGWGRGENTTSKRGGAEAAASPGARGGHASAGGAETCPGGAAQPSVIKDPGAEGGGDSANSRKATGKRPVSGRGKGEPAGGGDQPTVRGVGVSAATTKVGEGGGGERNTSAGGGGEEVGNGIEKGGGGGGKHPNGGGESVQGAKKRPRASSGEGVAEGSARGGGGMQLSSLSPKFAAPSSEKRRRLLEGTSGGRPGSAREGVVSSPRRSTPRRSKVNGVDASAPVAPVVVERLPKSVIVSDTDEERSAKAACGERRGGGSKQRQDHVGDGSRASRPQKAPAFADGRDWPRNTVVPSPSLPPSPSRSASAVLTASAPGKEPAAVVTGESDAARRAISPSSASSSSCVSFSTPSLSVVDAGAEVGPKGSGGKCRSAEPYGGRGEAAGTANGGSAKTSTLSKRGRGPDKLDTASGGTAGVSGGEVVGSARSGGGRTAAPQRAGAEAGRGEGKKDAGAKANVNGGPPQAPGPAGAASYTAGCDGTAIGSAAAAALPSRFASSASAAAISTPAPSPPAAAAVAAGIGKSVRPGPESTTTTGAASQCPRKKIELAKFEAIKNQAYRQAQEYCRKQLAPLEAERRAVEAKLEAMKQTLRKTMRDAHDKRVSEIEAFKANLYSGTDATEGGS
ncbi:unnamed protein product [Ectocarpus sp. 6 AP-2014]